MMGCCPAWARRAATPLLLALAAVLAGALPAQAAHIERSRARIDLPPGRSVLSAYLNPGSGDLVLHVQPLQAAQPEQLIDARSGRAWHGTLPALLHDAQHLGSENIERVASGNGADLALLRRLGCSRRHIVCTSPLDADVLLLVAPDAATGHNAAQLTVIDLRALLAEMQAVLAGQRTGSDLDWGDDEWQALDAAALRPDRRARWLDALRSVRRIDAFQQLLANTSGRTAEGTRLAARPMFQGADPALDLRGELELLGHRLLVDAHARTLLAGGDAAAQGRLADALEAATQPPNAIGVATHLVDELGARPPAQRQQLAQAIGDEADRRRSEVLHCFAQWLRGQACGAGTPPWLQAQTLSAATPPPATTPPRPPAVAASAAASRPSATALATPAAAAGGDAPHEWTLIQALPNKLVLVAFNEASGRMEPDRAVVGGFSFVARALGPVQDGRFEVEVAAADQAPVRLRFGQYRVRARLVLDFTREDQCLQGMVCWFSRPELHAKSVPRELVFFMTVAGRHVDRRRVEFGSLLPLVADGNARYRSQLKEARLAVESVRFELL